MTPDEEASLLARAQRGDMDAYSALVRAHQEPIRRYLTRYLRDAAAADDVAQEAFVTAFRELGGLELRSRLAPWLFGIARHRAQAYLRAEARRRSRTRRFSFWSWLDDGAGDPSPDDHQLEVSALLACLELLPGPQAQLIREHYYAATSLVEIARRTGKTEVAVRVALFRARTWLKLCIAKRLHSAPSGPSSRQLT